jgi:RNA polymerase sigma-70 factor (ECF subfamily)
MMIAMSETVAPSPAGVPRALADLLADAHARAAATFAPVVLDLRLYVEHVLGCLERAVVVAGTEPAALSALCLEDLYLSCAAGHGCPGAGDLLVERFIQPVAAAIQTIDRSPAFVDEVRQATNERLLVACDGPPRILQYGGRAPLRAWITLAARRAALGILRSERARLRTLEHAAEEPLPFDLDPELQYLKTRYRGTFKEAVAAALSRLNQRQRTVIRLQSVAGLTLAQIGVMLGVDDSTVSRWLQAARGTILQETQRELGIKLGLRVEELPSLVRLMTSQLEVSVARLLGAEESGG